ncbi:hypothetical protein CCHL11_06135 [Colletotrichum chlorophyti]|uniref:Uncharacterized protein n=1 Tax=Colletotrichum chlorophyti TaxID=708187 RepID=A0A1Q8RT75_9PEZI|nr:hypothetical protein CCHL11_06135 [Colletotrichum chlorophyti]
MSSSQVPSGEVDKTYASSVFSQDTIVGSDTHSLHPLLGNRPVVRNADGTPYEGATNGPLKGTDPQPFATDNFFTVSTRVVKEIPRQKAQGKTSSDSPLSRLRNKLKPPAVKAFEELPNHETKTYHVDDQGRIIETTVRRAGMMGNMWAAGGGFS